MRSLAVLALLLGAAAPQQSEIKVLFLGDRGHHKPADRAKQLTPVLAEHGIAITYTEDANDLNAQKLAAFDVLILYANIDAITPDQEKALLGFVEGGRGFVPIHCASYCFRNSDKVVALVGAQFKSHGTGTFRAKILRPDHPAMQGVPDFESWDETYVHAKHNEEDRTVLAMRDDEPWTWVRTPGKGRVFYTAWGHDERTWGNEGFQKQIEQGIRWAAGRSPLDSARGKQEPERRKDLKPFEYKEANIPFYNPPGNKSAKDWNKMQLPLEPAESAKHLVVPPGFEVKLFASEPDIVKPIAMSWDARGRLWILESVDYPNDRQPDGEGHDRIKICEDTDGDGVADKFTIFADKLSIPTSLAFANGGVIVTQAPYTLFLRDTKGDDRADERRILFSGWGTGDTHAGPSNLRCGFDNWIWGMCGYSGFRGTVGGKSHQFQMGFWRMKPDGSELEFVRSTNNNSWGVGLSEEGIVFGSTANGNPSEYMPIANRYYESVQGWAATRLGGIAGNAEMHPITDRVRQVDWHGHFTAAAGHALYTARLFPKEYWNRTAFVCEPTGHLAATFLLEAKGSGFASRVGWNFVASDDEWSAPIAGEVGPDGAVWVIDWYNYIVQHNPTPKGFKTGKGNAYDIDLRDKTHGRIYRIYPKGSKLPPPLRLDRATPEELVAVLKNDNLFWRLHAQRLLVERGKTDVVPLLEALACDPRVDAIGLSPAAIHAVWTLRGLGAPVPIEALSHPSAGVRRAAAPAGPLQLLDDRDAQVRLAALLALAEAMPSLESGKAVYAMLEKPENAGDRWIPDAATAAAARHDAGFLKAVLASMKTKGDAAAPRESANLLPTIPGGWRKVTYSGKAELVADEGREGRKSLKISSADGADASWSVTLDVRPQTRYRLSGWVKTRDLAAGSGKGALFNIHELQMESLPRPITGAADWKRLEMEFSSGSHSRLTVNCLFGGWGRSKGEAWWEDVQLVELAGPVISGRMGEVVGTVTRHFARRGPGDSIVTVLSGLKGGEAQLRAFVLDGLAEGWPKGTAPTLSDNDRAELVAVISALPVELRDRLLLLADKWGRRDLFADHVAAVRDSLATRISDASLPVERRVDAARRMIRIEDRPAAIEKITALITPLADPALVTGLLEALSESRTPETAGIVLSRWANLTPATRRAGVALLLRLPAWTTALLDAIEKGTSARTDLAPDQWQQLRLHSEKDIAARAEKLEAAGPGAIAADREQIYRKLLPFVEKKGDIARGKTVFANLCAKCHAMGGEGGKVGPELTGIGARSRKDILVDIVDPNRSVEANYRLWQVKTTDGQVLAGRLDGETATTIELYDVEGKSHVLQRKDIEMLKASNLSSMPVGLIDQLPEEDVAGLIEHLASSREPPKKK
jgi:putative membrane-bound dehydrogenase-like protein